MAINSVSVTVGTAATDLAGVDANAQPGMSVLVKVPAGGQVVYLGGSGVTTTNGYPVAAGESASFDLGPGDALYGIVAATTQDVNVLRTGV